MPCVAGFRYTIGGNEMKTRKSIALLLMLLVSAGAFAEGGKVRGDEGQGGVVQNQVREVDPPAQWTASSVPPVAAPAQAEAEAAEPAEELEDLF
jgi:hypothetical protein